MRSYRHLRNFLFCLAPLALMAALFALLWRVKQPKSKQANEKPMPPAAPLAFASLPPNPSVLQYAERIHGLGNKLPEEQQRALLRWMTSQKPLGVDREGWNFLVNEGMDKLCAQVQVVPEFTEVLTRFVTDKSQDVVLRDFSIQHLGVWLQPENASSRFETDRQKRQVIAATLLDAAAQPNELFSGTALQSMNFALTNRERSEKEQEDSARFPFDLTLEQIHDAAIRLATAKETRDSSRITALQVCAQRGFKDSLPIARRIAGSSQSSICARLSAIAAIGALGTGEDQKLLENLLSKRNSRLGKAIAPALERLAARNQTSSNQTAFTR